MRVRNLFSRIVPRSKRRVGKQSVGAVVEAGVPAKQAAQIKQARGRIALSMLILIGLYGAIGGRLVYLGLQEPAGASARRAADRAIAATRPMLVDRNGEVLAMDLKMASLFAEPRRIVNADEAFELLSTVLPDLDFDTTYKKLSGDAGFVWLKREITPKQQAKILALGVPGIGFRTENRRFYPGASTASHIVGHVNIDNEGIAGMEKYVDDNGLADLHSAGFALNQTLEPVKLSIDLRVQHFVRDALASAMKRYRAIAAGAVVLDVNTGEVIAMSSLPDYNPNNPVDALKKDRLNRMSAGTFEMGSTFKTFTIAMGLDSGRVSLNDSFDARRPIRIGRRTINDFHGKRRWLTVPEVFIYSSNIGTAKVADKLSIDEHQEFLTRLGLLSRMKGIELPEVAYPTQPKKWKKVHAITISFGHGVSTTPLQTAVAAAALVNGGKLIPPTFLPRSEQEASELAEQVISPETSDAMRYLMRLNVKKGSGRRSEVPGYRVGGKTGTAEKVVNGRYVSNKRFNAFLSTFPVDDPKYVVLVVIDEPKPEKGRHGATAGSNAAPTVAEIIRRSAPLLGVDPKFNADDALVTSY